MAERRSSDGVPTFFIITPYQRLLVCLSSKGLILAEMASRARKIRDRTVPMGQSIATEISS
jgi:hypothetical protein